MSFLSGVDSNIPYYILAYHDLTKCMEFKSGNFWVQIINHSSIFSRNVAVNLGFLTYKLGTQSAHGDSGDLFENQPRLNKNKYI